MAIHRGTYSCGHTGEVNFRGRSATSMQYIADRHFEGLCPACQAVEDEKQTVALNDEYAKAGNAVLVGSPKQILWAFKLRTDIYQRAVKTIAQVRTQKAPAYPQEAFQCLERGLERLIATETRAKWYIDNKDILPQELLNHLVALGKLPVEPVAPTRPEPALEIVRPSTQVTEDVAEVSARDTSVRVISPKNQTIIDVVRSHGFQWRGSGYWELVADRFTGSAQDRAADVGNALLAAGVPLQMRDATLLHRAISGEFEPQCKRWITYDAKGELLLLIADYADAAYAEAKRVLGARKAQDAGRMAIPISRWRSVLDFVDAMQCRLTEGAESAIAARREQEESALVVSPKARNQDAQPDSIKAILNQGSDIIDDLKD